MPRQKPAKERGTGRGEATEKARLLDALRALNEDLDRLDALPLVSNESAATYDARALRELLAATQDRLERIVRNQ